MGRSLSLAAYRALSRRKSNAPGPEQTQTTRPDGELLWAHVSSQMRFGAIRDLASRLRTLRPGTNVLITYDAKAFPDGFQGDGQDDGPVVALASDHPSAAHDFLDHWKPDICLWTGGKLMVNLASAAAESGMPMILADVGNVDFASRRHKWFPDLTRTSLDFFHVIMANSDAAARTIRRLGISKAKILVTPRLRGGAMPPACSDEELGAVLNVLAGRPVWLAAQARADEFAAILSAHRSALRLSHRLLLILTLAVPAREAVMS